MSDNIIQNVSITGDRNIVVGTGNVVFNPLPPAEARLRHDLGILLRNVENTWIKGVLEKSVHEAAMLELGMELREEAIDNPWRMALEGPDQPRETLPWGRKIKDIFDEANRLLLILGEPGSGKTTTLLQLARDLIAEVDEDFAQPVPVILNLSTWTDKGQPLVDWMMAELSSKYRVPKKDGRSWLESHRILPLLDGLDEVKLENRAVCVEKINELVMDYGLQGLAVCSRIKDYTDLDVRLAFYRAIYLQPLTFEQVNEYLDQAGDELASLRATLQADETLLNMARSPLILNIMSLAYQDTSAQALTDAALSTDEARHRHLFDTYITRMFSRKVGARSYDDEMTRQRLIWLARNMQKHNQEVFLIEGLQPSWLPTRRWQWVYVFGSRLVSGLLVALILACGLIFSSGLTVYLIQPGDQINPNLIRFGLPAGLIAGISIGFIDVLRFEWLRKRGGMRNLPTFWWIIGNVLGVGLLVGLLLGLIGQSFFGDVRIESVFLHLVIAPFLGLSFGLIFGIRGSQRSSEKDIQPVETLRWSWLKAAERGLIGGLLGGVFAGLILGLLFGLSLGFSVGLLGAVSFIFSPCCGFFGGLIGAIFGGLASEIRETKSVPNQGIRLSVRNAIFGGLIVGLIGLIVGLIGLILGLQLHGLNGWNGLIGLIAVLTFGLMGVLWYGGLDLIQHYTLRLILVIQGPTPSNYARFLEYAVERIFLQKVGGGYRFVHRLLLEHFAQMGETSKAQ